ncbi:MAG: TatD family hydrolase [Vibrionaceae bacterium]|nr:TatD family hydrolase [Vibrionaceae bacterium]
MRLFDTHCHFDFKPFSANFPHHLAQAKQQGVERFLIPAIGPSNWQTLLELSHRYSEIYFALGFHPYFLDGNSPAHLSALERLLGEHHARCVAVGECGLDAMIEVNSDLQEQMFIAQIELAKTFQKPLVLHSRKTHNRIIQLLKLHKFSGGGVIHGFAGSYQQAMQYVELGFYIGVGGVITYPRANKTRQAVAKVPLDSLILETDSPDMPLNGYQGEYNHPKLLSEVLASLAELKEDSRQTIARKLWENSSLLFGICE